MLLSQTRFHFVRGQALKITNGKLCFQLSLMSNGRKFADDEFGMRTVY